MSYQIFVAMNVTDPEGYARYRAAMTPILEAHGGSFVYDLVVSRVLKAPSVHPITRMFSIRFPSRAASEAFFSDRAYKAAKSEHFDGSVNGYSIMAELDG